MDDIHTEIRLIVHVMVTRPDQRLPQMDSKKPRAAYSTATAKSTGLMGHIIVAAQGVLLARYPAPYRIPSRPQVAQSGAINTA